MAIIISKNGKNAERIEETPFGLEDNLQQYISDNPDAIPIYEIDENIRLLILAREFPTGSGPIDAFGIDQSGNIYLVETKLYKNPDKRTVVAQVLDYGASLWRSSIDFDEFSILLSSHSKKLFGKSSTEMATEFFGISEESAGQLFESVRANLNSGTFKFVVLMDKLERRLRDLVLFLNQNSQFDVFAVELEYYKKDEFEIIIPIIHGTEVKKEVVSTKKGGSRKKWDKDSFLASAQLKLNDQEATALNSLVEFASDNADRVTYGTGAKRGSLSAAFDEVTTRSLFTIYDDGQLTFNTWINDDGNNEVEANKIAKVLASSSLEYTKGNFGFDISIESWGGRIEDVLQVLESIRSSISKTH